VGVEYFYREQQEVLDALVFGGMPVKVFQEQSQFSEVWNYDWSLYHGGQRRLNLRQAMIKARRAFASCLRATLHGAEVSACPVTLHGRRALSSGASPLKGFRVLELANVLAGPSIGQFLAELGADVIKVENPRTNGDVTRGWRLHGDAAGKPSAYFSGCNLGKHSVAIDTSADRGRSLCQRLAAVSDVVVASYKPGDAEKMALDSMTLRSTNPRLVYAQITGYGLDDPRVGYDAIIQAESGFTFMNGEPGSRGQPTKMPVALVDLLAAHQLKEAILLALWQRDRTGEGAHVHVSLLGAAVASLANQATGYLMAGAVPQRMGSDHPSICPYGTAFADKSGKSLVLAVGADSQFRGLCEVLGCAELGVDPQYAKNVDRVNHREELKAELARRISGLPRDELLERLHEKRVPAGAIADMPTVFEAPQAQALVVRGGGTSSDKLQGEALGLRQVAWRGGSMDDAPTPCRAPGYAEHTKEVLEAVLGLEAAEVHELIEAGIVETSKPAR